MPREAEEVVLHRLELGRGHVLVERGGVAPHALTRLGQAEGRLGVQALGQMPHPVREPGQGPGHLLGRHGHGGERRQAARRRGDLAVEQVEEDGAAGGPGHRGVAERGPQLQVGQDELLNRFEIGHGRRKGVATGRFGDRRRVPLDRRVHRRAPAPAAAPPLVSAR